MALFAAADGAECRLVPLSEIERRQAIAELLQLNDEAFLKRLKALALSSSRPQNNQWLNCLKLATNDCLDESSSVTQIECGWLYQR